MSARRPLDGVRVLDLTRLLPGAYATLLMADLGADVVKVEDPRGGDPARTMPPLAGGTSVYFSILNRNKRSLTLDLRHAGAGRVLDRLLPACDVLVESFRPQTSRRLGVDAARLRARHPRLIHASITGFGQTGPYAERAAHDINYEAMSGILSATRPPDRAPAVPRTLIGDIGAAMNGAAGILAALYARERTGVGAAVDVAIHEAALSWLLFPAAADLMAGGHDDPRRLPIDGGDACYNVYRTADDRYLALGALEPKFWRAFCERIGRADLIAQQDAQGHARARVLEEVRAIFASKRRDEWLALFADVDVCISPVNTLSEALADPHITARGVVARAAGSTWITTPIAVTADASGPGWAQALAKAVRPAPALGADTDEVLEAAGIDASERAKLRSLGVL
ncbi:MAG: CaiB/BaiF CoA transferase family protein [Betaproteobacteria bacterium]